jgi:hypothetical protein
MHTIIRYEITRLVAVSIICCLLFSFTFKKGGEGFEIFLNQQVLTQQFGNELNTVKSLSLNHSLSGKNLIIKYHHCGQTGTNRAIAIRDDKSNLLKEWQYPDAGSSNKGMLIPVNELLKLQKLTGNYKLTLYYSSSELPKGRALAIL